MNKWKQFDHVANLLTRVKYSFVKYDNANPRMYAGWDKWSDSEITEIQRYIEEKGQYYENEDHPSLCINEYRYWESEDSSGIYKKHNGLDGSIYYDYISDEYDEFFDTDAFNDEENQILSEIGFHYGETVLDIGCGTGMFLDHYKNIPYDQYVGVDVSTGMLAQLFKKHGRVKAVNTKFEDFYMDRKFDKVISLFGSFSYIGTEYLGKVKHYLKEGGKAYVMMYADSYFPVTYKKADVDFPRKNIDPSEVKGWEVRDIGKYIILSK